MKTKVCSACGIERSISQFYKHSNMKDGYLNKCKKCRKVDREQYRNDHIEEIRKYDRERSSLPHRVATREAYAETAEGRKRRAEGSKRWADKHPAQKAAITILGNAVRDGRIIKEPCEVCKTHMRVQGHHEDYTKPLDVNWLCITHHSELHKGRRSKS